MAKHKKTFYDVYSELWELLDKPRLKFWQRMRAKQLLNQLLRLHATHIFYGDKRKMTKEELKKGDKRMNECETDLKTDTENALKKAINKITILEAKNKLLEAQIEKMKCCENCKHHCFLGGELKCMVLPYEEELKCMKTKEYWEIKEK